MYGRTIFRDEVNNTSCGIFKDLKLYGSSKKYKGLINIGGEEIFPTGYEKISPFIDIESDGFTPLIVEKNNKKGLISVCKDGSSGKVLTSITYDDFFYANEFTLGYIIDNTVGFMSLEGKIITDCKFIARDGYNLFNEGKAMVKLKLSVEDGVLFYINHYGDIVEYDPYENGIYESTFGNGTGYYPFGDLPNSLDAFEGDKSNMWNID